MEKKEFLTSNEITSGILKALGLADRRVSRIIVDVDPHIITVYVVETGDVSLKILPELLADARPTVRIAVEDAIVDKLVVGKSTTQETSTTTTTSS